MLSNGSKRVRSRTEAVSHFEHHSVTVRLVSYYDRRNRAVDTDGPVTNSMSLLYLGVSWSLNSDLLMLFDHSTDQVRYGERASFDKVPARPF